MRNETCFRTVQSKNGVFSPHISKTTADRLFKYCKTANINRTKFVEECINVRLDTLERELYESKTKEELIEMLICREGK